MARSGNFLRAFFVSFLGTGLSRVMGLVRDTVIAAYLGADTKADAFWMAFTVPNTFRRFVADEGLTGALVPGIARAETEGGEPEAQSLAGRVLTALLLMNAAIIALGVAFPEPLVYAFASGFAKDPEKFQLTVSMTRWMMPFLSMVSLVSFFEGLLNHRGHFFVPKIAPGLVSAGIAGMAVLAGSAFSEVQWALVAGVWVGGIVHVLVHLPVVWSTWGPVRLLLGFRDPRFRSVMGELSKVIGIGLFGQLNILVLRQLASFMSNGAVSHYTYATRLVDLAQGIIAVAIGSALLPNIASAVAKADWVRFRSDLLGAFRLAAFLLFPAAVGVFIYAVPLTSMVFFRGEFSWIDVTRTAECLQLLTPFMLSVAGVNIVKRVFFALDERNALLYMGAVGVAVAGVTGWLLLDWEILGLATALSLATGVQFLAYVLLLRRRLGTDMPLGSLVGPLGKMGLSTLPLAAVAWVAASQGDWSQGFNPVNAMWFFGGIGGAAVAYGATAWILGIEELRRLTARVAGRFGR